MPGRGRITLALSAVAPAAMAYPWHTVGQRWILGVAIAVVVMLFGWWRGLRLTTIVRRRLALLLRGKRVGGISQLVDHAGVDARKTVVLRVLDSPDSDLPLDLIAGYLDRYGVQSESLRVTSRDTETGRTTWIGLTMSAAANLSALQARSVHIPLRETAEITLRRLADQLRECGWSLTTSDDFVPDLLGPDAKEQWRAVADGSNGFVAAYSVAAQGLPDTLTELWSRRFGEVWTAIEVGAAGVAAGCVIRTEVAPPATPPLVGLTLQRGSQWEALHALAPTSTKQLDAEVVPLCELSAVRWPANGVPVRT